MKQILIDDQKGPLPITVQFTNPGTLPLSFQISGSGYTLSANTIMGIDILIDGKSVGQSTIFSNTPTTHRATVTRTIIKDLDPSDGTPAQHSITLNSIKGTLTDTNDTFSVVMSY